MASFHILDYAVLAVSMLLSSLIGVFFAWKDRRNQNNAEFLLGSRQLGVVPVSLSLMASFMSAITVLAYPAEVYSRGAAISVSIFSSMFATICAGELMVPVFYRLRLTSMNVVSTGVSLSINLKWSSNCRVEAPTERSSK